MEQLKNPNLPSTDSMYHDMALGVIANRKQRIKERLAKFEQALDELEEYKKGVIKVGRRAIFKSTKVYCKSCNKLLSNEYDNFEEELCFKCFSVKLGDYFYSGGNKWLVVYKKLYASGSRAWLTLCKTNSPNYETEIITFFRNKNNKLSIRTMDSLSEDDLKMTSEIIKNLNNEIKKIGK